MSAELAVQRGLSASRLSRLLAGASGGVAITAVECSPVGTGQMADSFRLRLQYASPCDGPSSVIAKIPSLNEASRGASRLTRCYELETSFYSEMAGLTKIRTPKCLHNSYDAGADDFLLLLEDLAPARQGDQLTGCTVEHALAAVGELTGLHGPLWRHPGLEKMSWLGKQTKEFTEGNTDLYQALYPGFCERYADRLGDDIVELGARFVANARAYFSCFSQVHTAVHRDYRLDNLLFGVGGAENGSGVTVAVVDWQTVGQGPGISDLSYFIGAGLLVDERRTHEELLVREYQSRMLQHGVGLDWDDLWWQYRLYSFSGFAMAIAASMLVKQTERGDEMFMAMAARHGRQAIDLESEKIFNR